METFNIWYAFALTLFLLYVFLGIFYLYYTNTNLMRKKGYKPEYINFLKKDIRTRVLGIGIALPVIMFLAGLFVKLIFGDINFEGTQMLLFFAFFFVMVLPFPIIDNRKIQKKYKKLAHDSESEIVLDFNYKQLHKIFSPVLEITATILYIIIIISIVHDFHVAFLHFLILWIIYFTLRSAKYMVKPSMRDAYMYTFIFLMINQALLLFYLLRETLINDLSIFMFSCGLIIALFLALKLIYYLIGFVSVRKELARG